jgi:outer membrane protein, heavy metal efflux system
MRCLWSRWTSGALVALALNGCQSTGVSVEPALADLASRQLDPEPKAPAPAPQPAQRPPGTGQRLIDRLDIPRDLPGANAPGIQLPPASATPAERKAALERLYPPLPPTAETPTPLPGPEGRPVTLADLQRLALTRNPSVRQAAADVEAAAGAAVQAGLPRNPVVGYEGDTINQAGTAGMQGLYLEQTLRTGGKLQVAQAAAALDVVNARLTLRQVQNDVMSQVRQQYFAVLVARESLRVARVLARFSEEVYRIDVEQVSGLLAAAYEPLPLRVLAMQARATVVQAANREAAAWRQLTAAAGAPELPPSELSGRADLPAPQFQFDELLGRILSGHSEVLAARNAAEKARLQLRLARLTPVPDVDLRVMTQKDFTTPPFRVVTSVQVGVPVPVWDRNQGNIRRAEADLVRAQEQEGRVRVDLQSRLADAYQRYDSARVLLGYYVHDILPDQVRTYRGIRDRHDKEPNEVAFVDVATAQQDLANTVTGYLSTLSAFWSAVVDVAALLQTTDLFQLVADPCSAARPDAVTLLTSAVPPALERPPGATGPGTKSEGQAFAR